MTKVVLRDPVELNELKSVFLKLILGMRVMLWMDCLDGEESKGKVLNAWE